MLSLLYAQAARARRRWYASRPELRRRLRCPVISVGNLAVGGSGKTPVVQHVARVLLDLGERPAILSRGYGREDHADGVVVVADGARIRAELATAGDEPLMLAQSVGGAAVLVSSDRYLAGLVAETHLDRTVHVLDDGFQHLGLERQIELLVTALADLNDPRTLPGGRLREPLEAAAKADAVLVPIEDGDATHVAERLGVREGFGVRRRVEGPRLLDPPGRPFLPMAGARALAVAGIARPERFFDDLRDAGWVLTGALRFRDHHPFSPGDIDAIVRAARSSGADAVLTTEKDMVRLLPHRPIAVNVAWVPLAVAVEPAGAFRSWLRDRLAAARRGRESGTPG